MLCAWDFNKMKTCWCSQIKMARNIESHTQISISLLVFSPSMFMYGCWECLSTQPVFAAHTQHEYPWPQQNTECVRHQSLYISPKRLFKCIAVVWMTGLFPSVVVRLEARLLWRCHLIMSHVVHWSLAASLQERANTCCLSQWNIKKPCSCLVCASCCMCVPYYSQAGNRWRSDVYYRYGMTFLANRET